ncbi:hypothetical protein [Tabrizicola soli]|uniref:Uncharacterized protein n=1 Tax=Tabrizicola soli TaxID=2185115 RepID=A0ABV7DR37_9RHOB|nr:hypothetical protein [Tabrizicola soli]
MLHAPLAAVAEVNGAEAEAGRIPAGARVRDCRWLVLREIFGWPRGGATEFQEEFRPGNRSISGVSLASLVPA